MLLNISMNVTVNVKAIRSSIGVRNTQLTPGSIRLFKGF